MRRAIVIVLDSFGIGSTQDASQFGDDGANTFLHIAQACAEGGCESGRSGRLHLPNMQKMGLVQACKESCQDIPPLRDSSIEPIGLFGAAASISTGKDTTSGHWEMMGAPVRSNWGYFPNIPDCFPNGFLSRFIQLANIPGTLANCHASGTEVIQEFGLQHLQTGKPICYTSADSVFQIACHENVFSSNALDRLCRIARNELNPMNIARVISRPFQGNPQSGFKRTDNRKDYSMPPQRETFLDHMVHHGKQVISVGKIADIFANKGISKAIKASGLQALMDCTLSAFKSCTQDALIFTNLVDFDTCFGHRRDIGGYASELEAFDSMLPNVLGELGCDDLLILTADHGCDPSWRGTDHTREHVPILCFGRQINTGPIGIRKSFADIGQSLASFFNVTPMPEGISFIERPETIVEEDYGNTPYQCAVR